MATKKILYWEYQGEDENNAPIIVSKEIILDESEVDAKILEMIDNYPHEPTIVDV